MICHMIDGVFWQFKTFYIESVSKLSFVLCITLALCKNKDRIEKYSWHLRIMLCDLQWNGFIYFRIWLMF